MDISKGFTIAQFQQNILKKTGGISASNLYAFQISNPDETKGYTLAKHFKDNLEEATGITSNDLVNYQSEAEIKTAGKIRQEGKEYIIQDGDIILFKFNV